MACNVGYPLVSSIRRRRLLRPLFAPSTSPVCPAPPPPPSPSTTPPSLPISFSDRLDPFLISRRSLTLQQCNIDTRPPSPSPSLLLNFKHSLSKTNSLLQTFTHNQLSTSVSHVQNALFRETPSTQVPRPAHADHSARSCNPSLHPRPIIGHASSRSKADRRVCLPTDSS